MTDQLALALLGTFESLRMAPTFSRGRRDERAGHVRHLTISGSLVVAQVRGPDDPAAFRSRIAVRAFGASEWARVEQDLAAEARFAADLLGGRMPPGVGEVFAAAGLSLVPLSLDEVAMDCTCERWPMPCVHLAATCYALARAFEEDPFGVFAWRGRSRDELLMHLRELRNVAAVEAMRSGARPARRGGRRASDRAAGGGRGSGGGGGSSGGRAGGDPADDDLPMLGGSAGDSWADDSAEVDDGRPDGDVAGGDREGAGWADHGVADANAAGDGRPDGDPADDSVAGIGGPADEGDAGGSVAADLADLAAFWGVGAPAPMVPTGDRPGAVTRPDALLDQLDPPPLAHDGRPIADLLRPAYQALPER